MAEVAALFGWKHFCAAVLEAYVVERERPAEAEPGHLAEVGLEPPALQQLVWIALRCVY